MAVEASKPRKLSFVAAIVVVLLGLLGTAAWTKLRSSQFDVPRELQSMLQLGDVETHVAVFQTTAGRSFHDEYRVSSKLSADEMKARLRSALDYRLGWLHRFIGGEPVETWHNPDFIVFVSPVDSGCIVRIQKFDEITGWRDNYHRQLRRYWKGWPNQNSGPFAQ